MAKKKSPKKKSIKKKKVVKALPATKRIKLDRVKKEEIIVSLVWIAVLVAIGIILNGTKYATPVLVVIVVGLVGSLIVINYKKS